MKNIESRLNSLEEAIIPERPTLMVWKEPGRDLNRLKDEAVERYVRNRPEYDGSGFEFITVSWLQ